MIGIKVLNLANGLTLHHSVVLLEGETDYNHEQITVKLNSGKDERSDSSSKISCWPVIDGRFKVLLELRLGLNTILFLLNNKESTTIDLNYYPAYNERFVRLLYVVCSDDVYSGHFQGPSSEQDRCTETRAHQKIILGAKLIQTFTSECFYRLDLSRKTFNLELDSRTQEPVCHKFVLTGITTEEAQRLSQNQLWSLVKKQLSTNHSTKKIAHRCKFLAFVSFTRYLNQLPDGALPETHNEIFSMTKGHCALGGGGLALIGTGCLHTWPDTVEAVVPCFTDSRIIDRNQLLDDSAYRRTYWACFATTLGATCHELGHVFDLCHSVEGIMGRGFDNVDKVFTLNKREHENSCETPVKTKSPENSFVNRIKLYKSMCTEWEGALWSRDSALWLYHQKWFNSISSRDEAGPQFNGKDIRSRNGIRVVIIAAIVDGNSKEAVVEQCWDFVKGKAPLLFRLPISLQSDEKLVNKKLMVIDSIGNTLIDNFKEF